MDFYLLKKQIVTNLLNKKILIVALLGIFFTYIQVTTTNHWEQLRIHNFFFYLVTYDHIGKGTGMYLLVMPFLASFIGGTLLATEKNSNRYVLIRSRISKKRFIKTTLLSSFILGGVAVVIPLLINLIMAVFKSPAIETVKESSGFALFSPGSPYYNLYSQHPILFLLVTIVIIFFFGGLTSNLSIVISYFTKKKYLEVIFPFGLFFALFLLSSLGGYPELSHNIFLNWAASASFEYTSFYLIGTFLILGVVIMAFSYQEIKKDD